MDLAPIRTRIQQHAAEEDPELLPLFEAAVLDLASTRPLDGATGKRIGASLRLLLAPRELGRVLASASLQDRLNTLVAEAVGDEREALLLDLSFGCTHAARFRTHPYRGGMTSAAGQDLALGTPGLGSVDAAPLVDTVRAMLDGYFAEQANPPRIEVGAFADELLITIHADTMIFAQLAPVLRDAALRIAPKVLIERQRN